MRGLILREMPNNAAARCKLIFMLLCRAEVRLLFLLRAESAALARAPGTPFPPAA